MRKRSLRLALLAVVVAAFAVAAPSAIAAPPPLVNHSVTFACDDVVTGGGFANCAFSVTNNGAVADSCTLTATFTELGVVRTRTVGTGPLAPGETASGSFSFGTQDTNRQHGASVVLRALCTSENGRQTTIREPIIVTA